MSDNAPIVNNSQFQSFYNEIYELINEDNDEYFMVKPTKSSAELDEMYNKYMSQSSDRKEKADAESLRQYGMTNRDHYYMLKSQLINGVEVEDDNPTYDPYDEEIDESYTSIQSSIFTNDLPMFTPLEFFEKIDENYSCFTEEESKDIKAWRESYALLGNGIKEPEYNKKNIRRMDILRKAIYQNNNEAILQCGWIPGVEFNSENRIKASRIVKEKMENKDYGILSYDEACIEEAKYSNSKKKAVSIVLCTGNSGFSKLIRTWQKTEFTHAAISLDDGIEKLYSFNVSGNGKFGGFSYESIEQGIKSGVKRIAIFTFLTTEEIYNNITKALNGFIDKAKDTSYSFLNVLAIAFNIPLELNNSMICSEFVDRLLKLGNVDLTNKTSSLVSPKDFAMVATTNGKIVKIFDDHPSKFKHSEMKRKIKNLKYSSLPIFEFVQYNTGSIITEAKSLPIQFDSDGNLLVNNIRQINFEQEYANSHRLLMEYDKTGNFEAMKYELAKMHFLITLLEKKIYKQGKDKSVKEIKVRARYLNDFKKYLKIVNANDRNFNFTEYFEQSPFNDAIIKIDKYTLKFGWEALKTMIK